MKVDKENPRDAKIKLAKLIIKDFHSQNAADKAEEHFIKQFVNKEIPDDIEERIVTPGDYKLVDLLVQSNLVASKGEAKRLIEQGGVKLNEGKKVTNIHAGIQLRPNLTIIEYQHSTSGLEVIPETNGILIQVGKRKFLRIKSN